MFQRDVVKNPRCFPHLLDLGSGHHAERGQTLGRPPKGCTCGCGAREKRGQRGRDRIHSTACRWWCLQCPVGVKAICDLCLLGGRVCWPWIPRHGGKLRGTRRPVFLTMDRWRVFLLQSRKPPDPHTYQTFRGPQPAPRGGKDGQRPVLLGGICLPAERPKDATVGERRPGRGLLAIAEAAAAPRRASMFTGLASGGGGAGTAFRRSSGESTREL
jgi:hypothetical protein